MLQLVERPKKRTIAGAGLFVIGFFLTCFAAYIRHIWWVLGMLMADQPLYAGKAVIAVLGVVFPPFGALHGVWLWFH